MPSNCAVVGCSNTTSNKIIHPNLIHHKFPLKNPSLCKSWVHFCKRKDYININTARICSDHFQPTDYERDLEHELLGLPLRKKLKTDAAPSVLALTDDLAPVHFSQRQRDERMEKRKRRDIVNHILCEQSQIQLNVESMEESDRIDIADNTFLDSSVQCDLTPSLDDEILLLKATIDALNGKLKRQNNLVSTLHTKVSRLQRTILRLKLNSAEQVKNKENVPLSAQQIKRISGRRVNWKTEDIVKALSVRSLGLKAYETARKSWKIPLPSVSTLRRWAGNFSTDEGILDDVIAVMKNEAKSMPEWKRICALSFDEISVSSEVVYDKKLDKLVSHSKVQVLLARGICDKWKQPCFYAYDKKMTKELLFQIITTLERAGYHVYSITSDLGGDNQSLWKALSITTDNICFKNPFDSNRNVFVFADVPHMLKLVRNHLLDDGIMLSTGTKINKEIFEKLIQYDKGELKLCPKLSHKHLEVTGAERMRVRYAAQLLSNHSATLAEKIIPDPSVSNFLRIMNDGFDILNSRVPVDSKNDMKSGFGMQIDKQTSVLLNFMEIIQSSRFIMKNGKQKTALLPCQKGFIVSIKSTLELYKALSNKYGLTYILTSRLNQDALESFFSCIRACGGPNQHPTPPEFRYRLRLILIGSQINSPRGTNCEFSENVNAMSAALLEKNKLLKPAVTSKDDHSAPSKPSTFNLPNTNQDINDEDALHYLAGYVAWKVKRGGGKIYGFPTAKTRGMDNMPWISWMTRGGLLTPCDQLFDWVKICNVCFNNFGNGVFENGFSKRFQERLREVDSSIPTDIVRIFVSVRINIRKRHLNHITKTKRSQGYRSINAKKAQQFVKSSKMVQ